MSEWTEHRLGEVCSRLSSGSNITAKDIHGSGSFPVFGGNGIRGYAAEANFSGECAIIGRQGAYCGNVRYFIGEARMSEHAIVACAGPSHNTRFLAYLLSNMNLGSLSGQAAQPGLSVKVLAQQPIRMPSRNIQERISQILGAYDDLIEVNRRRIAVLEEMARGLFEEWFVRFRFPGHEAVPILDTPDGPLPEGWQRVPFGTVAENFDRFRKPLSGQQRLGMGGPYPYYGAAKVFDYIDSYIFEGLHLLIAEDGSVITPDGFPVLQLVGDKFWVNNHAHVVKGCGDVSTEYLYLALSRQPIQGYITGAAQPKITQANLNRIVITIADSSLMTQFSMIASTLFSLALSLRKTNAKLAASRDLLLPRLISGQLAVAEATRELEEAA